MIFGTLEEKKWLIESAKKERKLRQTSFFDRIRIEWAIKTFRNIKNEE